MTPVPLSLFLILSIFLIFLPRVTADAAYVYYEDAECISGNYIEGKLIFAYDTSQMSGRGFTIKKYNGPCKYFPGGSYDFMFGSTNGTFMKNGYCIRCNGMIGCTTTRNSCKGFSTVIPYNSYTMTMNSTVEDTDDVDDEYYNGTSGDIGRVQEEVFQELQRYDMEGSIVGLYAGIGILCGFLSMMTIFGTVKAIRRLQRTSGAVNGDSLLEHRHDRPCVERKFDNDIVVV